MGRFFQGVGHEFHETRGSLRAEKAPKSQKACHAAGVIVGAGEAGAGIIVGTDDEAGAPFGAIAGPDVQVGAAIHDKGLQARPPAAGPEGGHDPGGRLREHLGAMASSTLEDPYQMPYIPF
jgi:hypothetical protein